MDGRWSLFLTAGFLGGLSGCTSSGRPATALPTPPTPPMAQTPSNQTSPSAALPLTPHSGKLQPNTHLTMGALAEQMADDANRPAPDREQFRAKARESYQKAVDTDPKFAPAYLALGASFAATNDRDQAVANFAKATQVAPNDAAVWAAQGNYLARLKEWDAAIDSLSRATQLDPTNKEYSKKLGFALARVGRVDEGYAMLAKCMSEAEARYNIARMLQHLEQATACRWYLEMALKADPNYEPAQEALAALTATGTSVRPVGYNESPAAAATAPVVQTASYAEPTTSPAQATPAQPIVVVNGATNAAAAPSSQPITIVNGNAPAATAPPTQPVVVSNRPSAAPAAVATASSGDLPRLPPVILGSRDAPATPVKVGPDGIAD